MLFSAVFLASPGKGHAQLAKEPQADSPDEFDAYLLVLLKATPADVISAAHEFERRWPRSELCAYVYKMELEAHRSLGDSEKALRAGEKALQAAPDNLEVLTALATILANQASDAPRLSRAEEYARKVLGLSKTLRIPKWIPPEKWEEIQGRLGSEAHAGLGLVAYKRGDVNSAVREFESAVSMAPVPQPVHLYRLGMLYRSRGRLAEAIQMFQRAAASNEPTIRQLAERQLKSLRR